MFFRLKNFLPGAYNILIFPAFHLNPLLPVIFTRQYLCGLRVEPFTFCHSECGEVERRIFFNKNSSELSVCNYTLVQNNQKYFQCL